MKADGLLLASGLMSDVNPTPDAREALHAFARAFLLSGGRLALAEYAALSEESRAIFAAEAAIIADERAQDVADAIAAEIAEQAGATSREAADKIADLMLGDPK